jgi:hypothetical protein
MQYLALDPFSNKKEITRLCKGNAGKEEFKYTENILL